MKSSFSTRRSLLAGAAALPALAVPHGAAATSADPIFALIERHKAAFRRWQRCGRTRCETVEVPGAPGYDVDALSAAEAAHQTATAESDDAAQALTIIPPATAAGVLALLQYVDAFNAGALSDSKGTDWQSRPYLWPEGEDEDGIDTFGYAILSNARRALEAMAVRSGGERPLKAT